MQTTKESKPLLTNYEPFSYYTNQSAFGFWQTAKESHSENLRNIATSLQIPDESVIIFRIPSKIHHAAFFDVLNTWISKISNIQQTASASIGSMHIFMLTINDKGLDADPASKKLLLSDFSTIDVLPHLYTLKAQKGLPSKLSPSPVLTPQINSGIQAFPNTMATSSTIGQKESMENICIYMLPIILPCIFVSGIFVGTLSCEFTKQ